MNRYAIITAGGTGSRMHADIPKQFLLLNHLPVLMHTIKAFAPYTEIIWVTLPEQHIPYWQKLIQTYHFDIPHIIVKGGNTRFESVQNAVALLPENGWVAVHDGARPCVTQNLIHRCFLHASAHINAVACIALNSSLRQKTKQGSKSVDRSDFWIVQTPQVFTCETLKLAYKQVYQPQFTDDASVVEHLGVPIECIQGDDNNIKITRPADLFLAQQILNAQ